MTNADPPAGRAVPASVDEFLNDWRARIRAWRLDERAGYDSALELLCELDDAFDALAAAVGAPRAHECKHDDKQLGLYRCTVCGTRWLLWPDAVHGGGWNLLDKWQRPGACCDNVAMGEQVEHLRDFDLQPSAAVGARPVTDDDEPGA